jgi:3-hydroxyacyl-[acyl-carrier-protein] dehydratase
VTALATPAGTGATGPALAADVDIRAVSAGHGTGEVQVAYPADLAELPALLGHYPGFPIVPGVFLVEAAQRAARLVGTGDGWTWSRIVSTRFLNPVFPGDVVSVAVTLADDGTDGVVARCKLATAGRPVAEVKLRFRTGPSGADGADPGTGSAVAEPVPDPGLTRDLREVLPHRFPMLLVDRVLSLRPGERLSAQKAISATEPCFRTAGTAAAYPWSLVVESWCQAAGLLSAWDQPITDVLSGKVMLFGSIAGIDLGPTVHPGDVLHHQVELVRDLGDTVVMGGRSVCRGVEVLTVDRITMALRPAEMLLSAAPDGAPGKGGTL